MKTIPKLPAQHCYSLKQPCEPLRPVAVKSTPNTKKHGYAVAVTPGVSLRCCAKPTGK